jgi:hypothetical protein
MADLLAVEERVRFPDATVLEHPAVAKNVARV